MAFVTAPRLLAGGAHQQGDLFLDAPFVAPLDCGPGATSVALPVVRAPGLLLAHTCDFARKPRVDERLLVRVAPAASPGDPPPLDRAALPPLAGVLPSGGGALLRAVTVVSAATLGQLTRAATLDAASLRAVLRAVVRHGTRNDVPADEFALPPDDPRVLWEDLDRAERLHAAGAPARDLFAAVERATEGATVALAVHHGAANPADLLAPRRVFEARLLPLADAGRLPADAAAALGAIVATYRELADVARTWGRVQDRLYRASRALAPLGHLLQDPAPYQVTKEDCRLAGIAARA